MKLTYDNKMDHESVLSGSRGEFLESMQHGDATSSNRLYFGENLAALLTLLDDPAVRGNVQLIYIDPPYATKRKFSHRKRRDVEAYDDTLTGSNYVEFIRRRLIVLRELLASDGTIYVHLDSNMAFHVKVIMDEVFGESNFRNWITRQKCHSKNYTRNQYGNVADYVLVYSRSAKMHWHRPYEAANKYTFEQRYPKIEPETGRRFALVPIYAPGVRNGETGQKWRGMDPPEGKHWQPRPSELDRLDASGEIFWSATGNPRRKIYADNDKGVPVHDIWTKFMDFRNQNMKETGYPTEKNFALLKRIIEASSSPGDLVLDCFAGSGTTLAVAQELGRNWIGIDNSELSIETITDRLLNPRTHSEPPEGQLFDQHDDNGAVTTSEDAFKLFKAADQTTPLSPAR